MTNRWARGFGPVTVLTVAALTAWAALTNGPTAAGLDELVAGLPAPSATPAPPAGSLEACAAATVAALTPAQRAGQVLMVGTPVGAPRGLAADVARYHLGGVFLVGRGDRVAAELRADLDVLQRRAGLPLLVSADQEGGLVQTLKGADFPAVPSAERLGAASGAELRRTAGDTARRLAAAGITMNLGPVADTVPAGLGRANPPIGALHRQYGATPGEVAADVATVVTASREAGVLTTVKHFPGLGRVRANTDTSTRAVDSTMTAGDPHLGPFAAGIRAGSAGVMISGARYPRLDPEHIALFSRPIITGLLRERLGYRGLVVSDDLGAAQAPGSVPPGERAVRFVAAGGDLALTIRARDAGPMTSALIAASARSPAFTARLTDAATHVVLGKYQAGLLRCPAPASS